MMNVAIVDAYSTGNQICKRLSERGVSSFHIQSSVSIPNLLKKSYIQSDFSVNVVFNNKWDELLKKVIEQQPTHVIAGSETGVLLADKIANALNLPGNLLSLSEARRNKYLMLNAVKDAGLKSAWQMKGNNLQIILSEIVDKYPVVIKPVSSSSGDGFHVCHNALDVTAAYHKIMGNLNILEEVNYNVLCQEFLQGKEYVINSVSYDGKHYISDVWEMQHRHADDIPMIIDSMTLLPPQQKDWLALTNYVKQALTALGINFGPAHTEVMLTQDGPSLIEVNARLMGGNIDACFKEALGGYDQIDALIDSIVTPENLIPRLQNGYCFNTCIAEVDFVFYQNGILRDFIKENEIRNLKTFMKFTKMPAIGSYVNKTSNTTNVEGLLYFMNSDYEKVIADRDTVVSWQKENKIFYVDNLK